MIKLIKSKTKTKLFFKVGYMSDQILNTQLRGFSSISLTHLNATASFLKRKEHKYLLNSKDFASVIKDLKKEYNVLEIDGKRVFSYDNVYMDTKDYLFYNQHQNKERSRIKARTRFYVEANMAFFEFKHKLNGTTSKYRYEFPSHEHGFITKGKKRFFDGIWQSIYGTPSPEISPSIKTNYRRITLVSKRGDERLTIDFDVKATNLRNKGSKVVDLKNLIIIESKSMKIMSTADGIMRKHGIRRAYNCSKYSLGIVYSGLAEKYDTFKETMNKIKAIRMETVRLARAKRDEGKAPLQKIIKNIKKDTINKVSTQIKNDNEKVENNKLVTA